MKALFASMMLGAGFLMAVSAQAQVPPDAPAGTTATCKDGSYFSGATKKGACRGHKGVKDWYGAPEAAAAGSAAAAKPAHESKKAAETQTAAAAPAAAAPAAAPAGSTGLCKDGSYYSGASKKGACRGHKGVKEWYGATEAPATAGAAAGAAAAMPSKSSPAMPMTPPTAAAAPTAAPTATPMQGHAMPANPNTMAAAPGGGAGKVWVNEESKVYHCQDDRYYGKTKKGEYMSEADALAKGNHASHGKACSTK